MKPTTNQWVGATLLALATLSFPAGSAMAQVRDQTQQRQRDMDQMFGPIFGSHLMTPAERNAYHARMLELRTQDEREAYWFAHRYWMQERARAQGITLPEVAPMPRHGLWPARRAAGRRQ